MKPRLAAVDDFSSYFKGSEHMVTVGQSTVIIEERDERSHKVAILSELTCRDSFRGWICRKFAVHKLASSSTQSNA